MSSLMVAYFLFYFWSERPFFSFCKSELIGAIIVLSEGRKSSTERRNGYSWFGEYARDLLAKDYPKWKQSHR